MGFDARYDVHNVVGVTSEDKEIISAPGEGFQHFLTYYGLQAGTLASGTFGSGVAFRIDASGTVLARADITAVSGNQQIINSFHPSFALPVPENTGISITISGAKVNCVYGIGYITEQT